jgi:sirohydrochlorin ferrochelatase
VKWIILLAHGSRDPAANAEVRLLAAKLGGSQSAQPVVESFLDLAEPRFEATLKTIVDRGAEQIVVIPLLVTAGRHLSDVRARLELLQQTHPQLEIALSPQLAAGDDFAELVRARAKLAPRLRA